MISRACLLFVPVVLLAQDHVPAVVDQELRTRVNGFYSNFMEGSFSPRKAEGYVADDTKDYFYDAGKIKFIAFTLQTITYTDDYTRATVLGVGKTRKMVLGHVLEMDMPQQTRWKIENGKWVWTYDASMMASTPMGGKLPGVKSDDQQPADPNEVKKDLSPDAVKEQAMATIKKPPMGIDKNELMAKADQPWSSQVVFTNGSDGSVQVGLDGPEVRGLKATRESISVPGHGTAVFAFKFDPADKTGTAGVYDPKGKIHYRFVVSPFNKMYDFNLIFPK